MHQEIFQFLILKIHGHYYVSFQNADKEDNIGIFRKGSK